MSGATRAPYDPADPKLRLRATIALPASVGTGDIAAETEPLARFLYATQSERLQSQSTTETPLIDIAGYVTRDPEVAVPLLVASTVNQANLNEFYKRDKALVAEFQGLWSMPFEWEGDVPPEPGWYDEMEIDDIYVDTSDGFRDHYGDWWQPRP